MVFNKLKNDMLALQPGWLCAGRAFGHRRSWRAGWRRHPSIPSCWTAGCRQTAALLADPASKIRGTLCVVRCDLSDRPAVARWNDAGATPVSEDSNSASLVAGLKRAERSAGMDGCAGDQEVTAVDPQAADRTEAAWPGDR